MLAIEEETACNGKPIRCCQVDVGEAEPRGIVCGARNFAVGDVVVVALPGATLPGGFGIAARKTYGHVSDGMICSSRELGIGDDHTGIIVLPPTSSATRRSARTRSTLLGLRDEVLDIAVTPDRAYALSMRGIAREAATAYGVAFHDPAALEALPAGRRRAPGCRRRPHGCDRLVLRTVSGLDPAAATPMWMSRRLLLCGMRPVSLAVDVTNYVMLELGQPLHAFDRGRLQGAIAVRRAEPGETLETLDHVRRTLDPEDLVITDDRGPIGLAGIMGGLTTEIDAASTDLVIEAAHFDPVERRPDGPAAQAARPRRPAVRARGRPRAAAGRRRPGPSQLLRRPGRRDVRRVDRGAAPAWRSGTSSSTRPARAAPPACRSTRPTWSAGSARSAARSTRRSDALAGDAAVAGGPTSRDPADLDEEVIRLAGYDTVPVAAAEGAGRARATPSCSGCAAGSASRSPHAGYVEAPSYPFLGAADLDALGLPDGDDRRNALRLANPLSEEEPLLRTTLLPGLLAALRRNVGRGTHDVALFEVGPVFRPGPDPLPQPPRPAVDRRPSDDEVAALDAALPAQPLRVAVVLAGARERAGWWGPGRPATWADAVEAARSVARAAGVEVDDQGRPARTVAPRPLRGRAPRRCRWSGTPASCTRASSRRSACRSGPARWRSTSTCSARGPTRSRRRGSRPTRRRRRTSRWSSTRTCPRPRWRPPCAPARASCSSRCGCSTSTAASRSGEGKASLAYALRFRAPDRTLTVEETSAAREAAVAEATRRVGAVQRA